MNDIDWKTIALAIREGRFEDIAPADRNQVADKIETLAPKKRGRPKNPECVFDDKTLNKAIDKTKKYSKIADCYDELISQGVRPGKAKKQVAEDLGLGEKSIERVLTILKGRGED